MSSKLMSAVILNMSTPFRNSVEQKNSKPTTKFQKICWIVKCCKEIEKSREFDKKVASGSSLTRFFSLCVSLQPSNINSNKFFYENFSKLNKTIYKRDFMKKKLKEWTGVLHALCFTLFFTEFMFVFVHDHTIPFL